MTANLDIKSGKVTDIRMDGITVCQGKACFPIPVGEIFAGVDRPIVNEGHAVIRRPFQVSRGDTIRFLVDAEGHASRASFIRWREDAILAAEAEGERRLEVTVMEIQRDSILAMDDEGVPVRMWTAETFAHLRRKFKKRLRPYVGLEQGKELLWLYPGDRILVQCTELVKGEPRCLHARIVAGGEMAKPIIGMKAAKELKKAFYLPYETVLYVCGSGTSREKDKVESELDHNLQVLTSPEGLTEWGSGWAKQLIGDPARAEKVTDAVLLLLDCPHATAESDYLKVCDELLGQGIRFDIVSCRTEYNPDQGAAKADQTAVPVHRVLGTWNPREGIYSLLLLLSQDMADPLHKDGAGAANGPGSSLSTRPDISGNHGFASPRLFAIGVDDQVNALLRSMVDMASSSPDRTAAFVFSIDEGGHSVQVEYSQGNAVIRKGFDTIKGHLQKSPIRDLALYNAESNTDAGNTDRDRGRFLYFLDALVGDLKKAKQTSYFPDIELSCRGFRIGHVAFDRRLRVCFLVASKNDVFEKAGTPQVDTLSKLQLDTLKALLLGRTLAVRFASYQEFATKANDYQFLAHEIESYVNYASEQIEQIDPDDAASCMQEVQRTLEDTKVACGELYPNSRGESSASIVKLSDLLNRVQSAEKLAMGQSKINLAANVRGLDANSELRVRHLILACALRNLVSNAGHQLEDYALGKKEIRLTASSEEDDHNRTFLVVDIEDNGPGIHARYQDLIWYAGLTTRKKGRGLGLASIRRAFERQNWGDLGMPAVQLLESVLYHKTVFRLRFPIEHE